MSSLQQFSSTVKGKNDVARDVITLRLSKPEDFEFEPGQFINLKIQRGGEEKIRSYSILSSPREDDLVIVIKLVEDGFASDHFKTLEEGDYLDVIGPFGNFLLDTNTEDHHWMIAGGTGMAPFYSMIKTYLETDQRFTLLFSAKTRKDLFLHDELQTIENNNPNFTYHPTLTREDWEGKQGRVQNHLPQDVNDKVFYLCGLKDLVIETKEKLEQMSVKENNIKCERYT